MQTRGQIGRDFQLEMKAEHTTFVEQGGRQIIRCHSFEGQAVLIDG